MSQTLPATNRADLPLEYWRNLVLAVIHNGPNHPELCEKIALVCHDGNRAGAPIAVWHAASIVAGTLDRCPCYPCQRRRYLTAA